MQETAKVNILKDCYPAAHAAAISGLDDPLCSDHRLQSPRTSRQGTMMEPNENEDAKLGLALRAQQGSLGLVPTGLRSTA
jgi:hypothetical protein